jgi:hypothetical protein
LQDGHRDHDTIQLELLDWVYRLNLDSIASSTSRDTVFQGRRFKFDKCQESTIRAPVRCLVQKIGIGISLQLRQDVLARMSELEVDVGFGRGSGGVEAFVPEARRLGVEVS